MDFLNGLFANKTILNMAMGKFKSYMEGEKISAIVVRLDPSATDTDGVIFYAYRSEIAVASGDDVSKIRAFYDVIPSVALMTANEVKALCLYADNIIAGRPKKDGKNGA